MMLAEVADATTEGPLADFKLTDKDRYKRASPPCCTIAAR